MTSSDVTTSDRKVAFKTWFELYPFERKVKHPNAYWLLVSCFLSAASAAAFALSGNLIFVFTFLPLALGGGLIPIATHKVYVLFREWEGQFLPFIVDKRETRSRIRSRFVRHFSNGTRFWPGLFSALLFIAISFSVWGTTGIFSTLDSGYLVLAVAVLIFTSFAVGVVLCMLYYLARLVIDIGRYEIVVTPHAFGILSLGHLLVNVYSRASLVWFVIALSGVALFRANPLPMAVLAFPTLLFVVGSFVLIQFPVHRQMKRYKRKELQKVDDILRKLIPFEIEQCSSERLEQIRFYQDLGRSISNLPEWPYHWRGAAGVTLSTLVAVSPSVASFLVNAGVGNKMATYFISN